MSMIFLHSIKAQKTINQTPFLKFIFLKNQQTKQHK